MTDKDRNAGSGDKRELREGAGKERPQQEERAIKHGAYEPKPPTSQGADKNPPQK